MIPSFPITVSCLFALRGLLVLELTYTPPRAVIIIVQALQQMLVSPRALRTGDTASALDFAVYWRYSWPLHLYCVRERRRVSDRQRRCPRHVLYTCSDETSHGQSSDLLVLGHRLRAYHKALGYPHFPEYHLLRSFFFDGLQNAAHSSALDLARFNHHSSNLGSMCR